ncbi:MAG: hypothetical protein EPO51_08340 [Phenylobacterium sp.]|uniref:hypothetical protein n=1 Tax=Phenylobacterium sp. TaxID=1871053 RepID=UPI001228AAD3|nr:hypothetical protein [Phenylobacterium sp.]TAJ72117.1 MAG: hypothetical protein EPO51_08340 [Phenylobacterium sp.]
MMRVAVIEVGSRSIRLLVADRAGDTLVPVGGHAVDLDLMRLVRSNAAALGVERLIEIVQTLRQTAVRLSAERIAVFGTEAARQLARQLGADALAGITLMEAEDEAQCSLTAAALHLEGLQAGAGLCAIDHGNGSLELAYGRATSPVCMEAGHSAPLGSDRLLTQLRGLHVDVAAYRTWAYAQIDALHLPSPKRGVVVVQGSVATKCAWLTVRRGLDDRYEPQRVHGHRMGVEGLRRLAEVVAAKPVAEWPALSRFVNPRDPPTDQIERLLTGCILLERLLHRLECEEFLVGAFGARYGMAWNLATGVGSGLTVQPAPVA